MVKTLPLPDALKKGGNKLTTNQFSYLSIKLYILTISAIQIDTILIINQSLSR